MRKLWLSAAVTAMSLAVAPVAAQQAQAPAKPSSISVSTSVTYEGSTATPDDDLALQAKARADLYRIAGRECAAISEALAVNCTIGQIQISTRDLSSRPGSAGARDGIVAEGRFTYLVTPRP
jgi:hypothetical protein